jgi:hypothetical protein
MNPDPVCPHPRTLDDDHCWSCGQVFHRTPDYGDRTAPALPLSWFKEVA